jgi:hypothetical protein
VAFLDSDDAWSPRHLRVLWKARAGVAMVSSSSVIAEPAGYRVHGSPFLRVIDTAGLADILRPESVICTSGTMVRTDVLRTLGGFRPTRFAEDLDLWARVLAEHRGRVLPDLTVASRAHGGQTSKQNVAEMIAGATEATAAIPDATGADRRAAARLGTVMRWDRLRATAGSPAERARLLQGPDWYQLPGLFWRRALRRHRWRLAAGDARELRGLLG